MGDRLKDIEREALLLGRYLSPVRHDETGRKRLDRSAYTLLTRLHAQGPMSIGQLTEAFSLDASTLNRQTAAMMRNGLVERIPDPDGGLARKFLVTKAGRDQLLADRRANIRGLRRVLEDWPEDDVATLADLLRRFNGEIEARDGRPWPRR
ncbi:MarR family winged helix-turn-helix transcriptional regulator [Nocardioides sp. Root151]|uniref:MarR family winged helix-turn-helix transcriptional regulator n=1 Tax=Nocardioides sp. Root151 TaxID=1736475 RepID=UPI0007025C37|nr:MarR family transcriptional regulator [Nocardioides sp. Root151]KQZ70716.1 transcriptional regulator [Nocardioides sp. Root151]